MAECGTYAGYQAHKRNDTEPCGPCRAACAAYVRAYRENTDRSKDQERQLARGRALTRLAARYPHLLERLIAEELEP